jgi:glycosyltransferase involved in cell wall biosynthesis
VVLPNGMVPMHARPPRQQTILFVGRLVPEKGVGELFVALGRLAPRLPDWRVAIIGRMAPRHRSRYRPLLADLRNLWGERLSTVEALPHAEVMQAFATAAITVVPSRWQEPFGRTALEALSAGSAVIAARSGGLPEIVGDAGLLLDQATPEAIAAAILSLVYDPTRRATLGAAGRARVAERFAIGELSNRLDAWRSDLLQR